MSAESAKQPVACPRCGGTKTGTKEGGLSMCYPCGVFWGWGAAADDSAKAPLADKTAFDSSALFGADPSVRRGWRGFLCDCGKTWKLPTRDHTSPSVETCPVEDCGLDTQPIAAWPDESLAVDKWGNLVNAPAAGEYSPNA